MRRWYSKRAVTEPKGAYIRVFLNSDVRYVTAVA